jgi:hypothetical protein
LIHDHAPGEARRISDYFVVSLPHRAVSSVAPAVPLALSGSSLVRLLFGGADPGISCV